MKDIEEYLSEIRSQIFQIAEIQNIERYTEQILTPSRANLRLRIRLLDGSLLEISEAVELYEGKLHWLSYRYHYQDVSGNLIFRYDNAPHRPLLNSTEHKHIPDTVISNSHPSIQQVLAEVKAFLEASRR